MNQPITISNAGIVITTNAITYATFYKEKITFSEELQWDTQDLSNANKRNAMLRRVLENISMNIPVCRVINCCVFPRYSNSEDGFRQCIEKSLAQEIEKYNSIRLNHICSESVYQQYASHLEHTNELAVVALNTVCRIGLSKNQRKAIDVPELALENILENATAKLSLDSPLPPYKQLNQLHASIHANSTEAITFMRTIGEKLAQTLYKLSELDSIERIILTGPVLSGDSGKIVEQATASMLNSLNPELENRIVIQVETQRNRRHGLSIFLAQL